MRASGGSLSLAHPRIALASARCTTTCMGTVLQKRGLSTNMTSNGARLSSGRSLKREEASKQGACISLSSGTISGIRKAKVLHWRTQVCTASVIHNSYRWQKLLLRSGSHTKRVAN